MKTLPVKQKQTKLMQRISLTMTFARYSLVRDGCSGLQMQSPKQTDFVSGKKENRRSISQSSDFTTW